MVKFCSLYSGSSGNSIFIGTEKTKILIDAGLSYKKIVQALTSIGESPENLNAVLITHEHSDHIKGIGVLAKKLDIPIYANEMTWNAIKVQREMIKPCNVRYFTSENGFELGNMWIVPFMIPHDAAEPVGFNFHIGSKKITTATDIGHMTRKILDCFTGSDFLLLESNHDVEMLRVGKYPWFLKQRILGEKGHLSNEMAGKVVSWMAEHGTSRFCLGHLSRENNFPELAYQTVSNALLEKNIIAGRDVLLDVALRDKVGNIVEL